MDLEEIEAKNDCADEGQQQFHRPDPTRSEPTRQTDRPTDRLQSKWLAVEIVNESAGSQYWPVVDRHS
jgi:hypothetical protein